MLAVTIIFMGMMTKGYLSRVDGMILLILLLLFIKAQFKQAKKTVLKDRLVRGMRMWKMPPILQP